MTTPTITSPVAELADALEAPLKLRDCGWTIEMGDGVYIYASIAKVRLHRPGLPVADLGVWDADAEGLAAAYRAEIGGQS